MSDVQPGQISELQASKEPADNPGTSAPTETSYDVAFHHKPVHKHDVNADEFNRLEHIMMIVLRFAAAFTAMAIGLFFGFASGPSYFELIAVSAFFHSASIAVFLVILRSTSRWLAGLGIVVNLAFLVELVSRLF